MEKRRKLTDLLIFLAMILPMIGVVIYGIAYPSPGPKCQIFEYGQANPARWSSYMGTITMNWEGPKRFISIRTNQVDGYTVRYRVFDSKQAVYFDDKLDSILDYSSLTTIKAVEFYTVELGPCELPTTLDKVKEALMLFVLTFLLIGSISLIMIRRGWAPSPWGPQRGLEDTSKDG